MEDFLSLIVFIIILFGPLLFFWVLSFIETYKKGLKYDELEKINLKSNKLLKEAVAKIDKFENDKTMQNQIDFLKKEHNKKIELIKSERIKDRLYRLAETIIDKECEQLDNLIVHLTMKNNPSYKGAEAIKDAKAIKKDIGIKYKQMKYEYDLLFQLFPELEDYFEKYNDEETTIEELQENYDCSKKYLTKEEYKKLDENKRNQLALDRYIESRKKSKWQMGRDYELYVGYNYQKDGYKVQYFGIEQKLEDLGRDIIAEKDDVIHIVQCKYWSKEKTIHEKHICQLYGTAIQYKKETKTKKKVVPVFVTQTKLSDKAKEFAKYLKVKVMENYEIGKFPRIKCNVGKKEKIYHLPFDQQYDNVIIEPEKGEFFAETVQEAIDKGYRRAKKWISI